MCLNQETYLDRLSLRYEKDGQPSGLAAVDIFVSIVDPMKEPPLVIANTVLSILTADYSMDKMTCYVLDDGAAMLTFEDLSKTLEFARSWVPFCKKFSIEPRASQFYFVQKIDYLKDKDGTPWPGNSDHLGMILVFLSQTAGRDTKKNPLPCLVYVSRETRPGFNHHKELTAEEAIQNCIQFEGDCFCCLGDGAMFPQEARAYIDDIAALIPVSDDSIHTALDTSCRVASWGAYLQDRNILAMSLTPRDCHEA
ncbi:hypothetical protein L7F22_004606 [Adiantum nelumboides]|nr:hypothetical protein [Adiantum nelumboides]